MESIALKEYPQVVWRNGNKMLWNPIHRKALKNRPEERVRLRIIEYLVAAGWSKHRISTEEAVRNSQKGTLRTDIICYNREFDPEILIECKAEHVPLTQKTAEQVARYNQNVQAPLLLMSNGVEDFWYRIDQEQKKVKALDSKPKILPEASENEIDLSYWQQRGFAGSSPKPPLRKWIRPFLQKWREPGGNIRYLAFQNSPSDVNISHYYRVFSFPNAASKLALGCLATAYGGSRIVGILNQQGQNKAVLEINLDLLFNSKKPNASIYSAKGTENLDIAPLFKIDTDSVPNLEKVTKRFLDLMNTHLKEEQ